MFCKPALTSSHVLPDSSAFFMRSCWRCISACRSGVYCFSKFLLAVSKYSDTTFPAPATSDIDLVLPSAPKPKEVPRSFKENPAGWVIGAAGASTGARKERYALATVSKSGVPFLS